MLGYKDMICSIKVPSRLRSKDFVLYQSCFEEQCVGIVTKNKCRYYVAMLKNQDTFNLLIDVFPLVFADSLDFADSIVLSDVIYFYRKPFDLQERSKPVLDTIVSYLNGKNWNNLIFRIGSNTGSEFAFGEQLIIMHEITSYLENKGIQEDKTEHELEVSEKK